MALGDAEQLRRHIDVLFVRDAQGRLLTTNEPDGDRAPRLFLARARSSREVGFRDDVSSELAEHCSGLVAELPDWHGSPSDPALYRDLRAAVAADGGVESESLGPAFRFSDLAPRVGGVETTLIVDSNAVLLDRFFPYTRSILATCAPVVGVVVDGSVVSACFSARRHPLACEAGVHTEEPYRGRGFGQAVVAAWADAVEAEGRQPLYSTSWDNAASLGIARKLGLIAYAETLSLG